MSSSTETYIYGQGPYGSGLYGGTGLVPGTTIPGAGGGMTVWFELWRATIDNKLIEDVSEYLTGGGVDLNHDRAITTQATFEMSDTSVIRPYVDYLAVFQNVEYDDSGIHERDQLGLFTTRVPNGIRSVERSEGSYVGYDLTATLGRRAFTNVYNVAAGTKYIDAVISILALAGITRYNFEASTQTLSAAITFPVGTTYLEAANQLLEAIGYYYLSCTTDGVPVSMRSRDVQYVEPFRTVTTRDQMQPVTTQPTDTTVANVVVVIQDNPNSPPLTAVRRNDAVDSPSSTVNLGELPRVEVRSNLADQAAVNALADRLLAEGRTWYQVASLRLLPDPRVLTPHQVVELNMEGKLEVFNGRWRVRTASIGFTPDAAGPSLEINRITDTLEGRII